MNRATGQAHQELEQDLDVDVVVVGGRVAGCASAIQLARSGRSVAVVERADLPSDTLSTHLMQDLSLFEELGVLDQVLACGAPLLRETNLRLDGIDLSADVSDRPWLCLRRISLDPVLSAAADRAGALMVRGSVVDLLRTGDRVVGVLVEGADGKRRQVRAGVVLGADGRNSTVARLVGAARYDVAPNERMAYWGYFADLPIPNAFHFGRDGRDLVLAAPCDGGLTLVAGQPPLDDERDWSDPDTLLTVAGEVVAPLRGVAGMARIVGGVRVVRRMDGFFREATGPGWALVGDSGHFKDVVVGQGICDALRQSRALARVLEPLQLNDSASVDASLQAWGKARDDDARPMYRLAQDLGRCGGGVLDVEGLRVLSSTARRRRALHEVLAHRRPVRKVSGLPVQVRAIIGATLRPTVPLAQVLDALRSALARQRDRHAPPRRPPAAAAPAPRPLLPQSRVAPTEPLDGAPNTVPREQASKGGAGELVAESRG